MPAKDFRRRFGMTGPRPAAWGAPSPSVTYACPSCGARYLLYPAPDPRTRRYPQTLTAYCSECRRETPHRVRGEGDLR